MRILEPRPTSPWKTYAAAGLFVGVALAVTILFAPVLQRTIYIICFAAIVLSAWYGGTGPALLATLVTLLGVELFVIEPIGAIGEPGLDTLIRLTLFVGLSVLIGSMHRALQATRARAERVAVHSALLAAASERLASSLDVEETLRNVARLAVPSFADWCAVDLLEDDHLRRVAVEHPDPAKVRMANELQERYPTQRDAPIGPWRVVETGEPQSVLLDDALLARLAQDERHLQLLRELRLGSAVIAPLAARSGVLGVLTLVRESGRYAFDAAGVRTAVDLARRGGIAIENARLLQETEAARARLEEQTAELEAQTEELQQLTEELEATTVDLQESNRALTTEKEAAEAARREAEEASLAKGQFLATMSHELRTPLNAITGYAELLGLGVHGELNDEQRNALQRIERNSKHLLGLINNVLNFVKLEARQVPVQPAEVEMQSLLDSMEPMIAPQLREKHLRYEAARCDPGLRAVADRERLEQVLLNLLTNAVKFTPEGGTIGIRCEVDGERVRIEVRDTGPGIPADKLEHIFEPFVQLETRHTAVSQGVGLGLAISRDLVIAMNGEISAGQNPGGGAVFTVTLPKA